VVDDINWTQVLWMLLEDYDPTLIGERAAVLAYAEIHARFTREE
jgi:hypothetical protein